MTAFSDWLRGEMDARGLRPGDLAKMTDVYPSNVRNWIAGATNPSWHNCRAIADSLHVSRSLVRELAGYVDDDAEESGEDPQLSEIVNLWASLPEYDREMLHRLAVLQRDSLEGPARSRRPG